MKAVKKKNPAVCLQKGILLYLDAPSAREFSFHKFYFMLSLPHLVNECTDRFLRVLGGKKRYFSICLYSDHTYPS